MRELVLECNQSQAEAWSDALLAAGALAVALEDADLDTDAEQALFGEPGTEAQVQAWNRSRLVALMADGTDPQHLLVALGDAGQDLPWGLREVPDADWVRLTQAQFGPIEVGARILIIPSWHLHDPELQQKASDPQRICLHLDPGLAFGTGSHPTTHLCLQWLADHLPPGASLLDYGCGSGILAIAAVLLGAENVWAVDIDPQAVQSTIANAAANQVRLQACLPDALPAGQSQAVVANILSNPLRMLAPMLAARLAAGGQLVLSGVLERQAELVAEAYAPWLDLQVAARLDGWVCLAGRKP